MKDSKNIIKDTLNKRIYEQDDLCHSCGEKGKIKRDFVNKAIFCRNCRMTRKLPKQFLTKKQTEEIK